MPLVSYHPAFEPNWHTGSMPALRTPIDTVAIASQLHKAVDPDLEAAKNRYLSVTRFEPEALVRFERSGSYHTATINPVLSASGRFVGYTSLFLGMVVDTFTVWQMDELESGGQ